MPTTLTMADGFVNRGDLSLATTFTDVTAKLDILNGELVNAEDGTIWATTDGIKSGSDVLLSAQLNNQGTLNVENLFIIRKRSASHTNSGTINVTPGRSST